MGDETILRLGRRHAETAIGYPFANGAAEALPNWRHQMRTISVILAFAFILAGPSMAGSTDANLPGIGTFAYAGSPVISTPAPMVVAYAR